MKLTMVEWPKGSGQVAAYESHEVTFMKGLVAQCERGEISKHELGAQFEALHLLKCEMGARMLDDESEVLGRGRVALDESSEQGALLDAPALPEPGENRIGKFMGPDHRAPETQRAAAIRVYPKSGSDRFRVLCEIVAADGLSDFEIENRLGMLHQAASARRNELVNDGWVEDSGERRHNAATNKNVAVWRLTEAGRAEWTAKYADEVGIG